MTQYHFDGLRLDTRTRRLEGPKGPVHLPPKPYEVLIELLREPGGVVNREALLERVWPERPASDETLSRTVADLRKYLDDDTREPRFIETVPKVGYRFVAPVERLETGPGGGRRPPLAAVIIAGAAMLALALGVFWERRAGEAGREAQPGHPVPLTSEIGDEDTPAVSPDGNLLAYAARQTGDENWDIRLLDLETGATRNLVAGPDREYAPVFSPDGREVAFLRYYGERCAVMVASLDGTERRVAGCRTPLMGYLDWSPDGRRIAYSDSPPEGPGLVLMSVDLDTGATGRLVPHPPPGSFQFAPRFSPDGRQIAFIQGDLEQNELWLAQVGEDAARQLTRLGGRLTGLDWNGDGTALYFATDLSPGAALWRAVPGEDPVRVREERAFTLAYDLAGKRLVYDQIRLRTNIWSVSLENGRLSGRPEKRIASTRIDNLPSVSPDGSRLAFVSDRTGEREIWLAGSDGEAVRRLTRLRATAFDRADWSPDGAALVYSALRDGRWTGYLHPLDGTAPGRLSGADGEIRHPVWSRGGDWILYADGDGIRRLSPSDLRDESVLALEGAVPLFEHGGDLFFMSPGSPGLGRLAPDGSVERILTQFGFTVPAAVTRAGDHVVFIATSPWDGNRRLTTYDLGSGDLHALHTVVSYTRQAHASAVPDGSVVYYSQTDDAQSDLVLLEGLF